MNRARLALGATVVGSLLVAGGALLAAQEVKAPPMKLILAGKTFTPPIKGEALVEYMQPVTKREGEKVVTRIQVKNKSLGPVARLQISETWYDKAGAVVAGGKGVINALIQPDEVQTIVISTPYNAKMNSNNWNFSHANGTVKPAKVGKFGDANANTAAPAAKPAAARKPAASRE
jgi:hypothetical protein